MISRLVAGLVAAIVAPTPALAACQVSKLLELPVTMTGLQPTITVKINGRDARMLLDSGAFFSTIARANAQEYGLKFGNVDGARLVGVGGETSLGVAKAKELRIGNVKLANVEFVVGGSDIGLAGLIGQNILGLADVEYDLPHGMVRLMKSTGCKGVGMAYWAGTKPFTLIGLETKDRSDRHTVGNVTIDGRTISAMFDTGAQNSLLSGDAARRLGKVPGGKGVSPDGVASGLGQGISARYRAQFGSIDIGGELIRNPWIGFANIGSGQDMLIGIEFFLTHRVYVDNQYDRMFVTYEGGPLFGLTPRGAVDNSGARLDLTDTSGDPTDAAGYSRRGAVAAAHERYVEAIADFGKAVALAPGNAEYLLQRAEAHFANKQDEQGNADLDKALALSPDAVDARMMRATIRLVAEDKKGALSDLEIANAKLAPSSNKRLELAQLFDSAEAPARALTNYDAWLHAHLEDSDRARAFNGRCWARAELGTGLDQALSDCDRALFLRPGTAAYLDSRALVRLRRGETAQAIADYDRVLMADPRSAWSLYARGIAKKRSGRTAQGDADQAAALAIDKKVGEFAKRIGIES